MVVVLYRKIQILNRISSEEEDNFKRMPNCLTGKSRFLKKREIFMLSYAKSYFDNIIQKVKHIIKNYAGLLRSN